MASINDLPIELLPFIFKYLGLVDLVRCRLVCKRWRFFCDEQKVTELIIKCDDETPVNNWYYTEKAIEQDCMINLDLFDTEYFVFRKHVIRFDLLRNLKRLKVHSKSPISSNCKLALHLYRFEQLEQLDLEFEIDKIDIRCWDLSISHSNLRIISIDMFFDSNKLDLDTQKLEVLKFSGFFYNVDIINPSSMKHLTTPLFNSFDQSNINPFANLEYLHGCCTTQLRPNILSQLPKLKELKFVTDDGTGDYELIENYDDYSDIKEMIIDLIRMKQTLQRNELKLYFLDIPLTGVKQFKKILRNEFRDFAKLDDSDESMDEDDVNDENMMIV